MAHRIDAGDPRLPPLLDEDRIGNLALANEIASDESGKVEVFIDSPSDSSGILARGGWVRIYARDDAALRRLEPEIPDGTGDSPDEASFAGVAPWIRDRVAATRELTWETPCWLYYLDPERDRASLQASSGVSESYPEGLGAERSHVEISGLEPQHSTIVNEHWDLGGGSAEDYIRSRIESGISSAAFVDREPVSWSLTHDDGQMGVMFTLPEYRRQGYGRAVTRHLIDQILEAGATPFLYAKHENAQAQQMAEAMGFVRWGDYRWFGARAS